MATVTWEFAIDLDRDGDFSGTGEVLDRVISAEWSLGFPGPFQPIARAAELSLTLRNDDREFSPENTGSSLYPNFTRGRAIRVRSTYDSVTRTHFLGWIDSIRPSTGLYGDKRTTIQCNGFMILAQDSEVFIPVQENVTADEVIELLLLNSGMLPPGFTGRWQLGSPGFSELDNSTALGSVTDFLNAEVGKSTFGIIGDTWGGDTSVYGALRDVAGREVGRVFVDRSGVFTFWNRHHLILDTTVDATLDGTMVDMDYVFGENVINSVIVRANSRTVGGENETLGQLDQATRIRAGDSITVSFRYIDQATGLEIGGKNAVAPAQTTDFTANSQADGSGVDYTSSVASAITSESGTKCEVQFTNSAAVDVWLQTGTKIQGLKITDYGRVDIKREDTTSITNYRRHRYTYEYPMDEVPVAEGAAAFFLSMNKDPKGVINFIEIVPDASATMLTQALTRTIGDRVRVIEDQTGTDAQYFIIGERFVVNPDKFRVRWTLEPAAASTYWVLGTASYSELGETTIIGPY